MADFHTKTFFGRTIAITITSPSKTVPYILLGCIKRKQDGNWENPSKGEGKITKLSIEAIICIIEVLERKSANWRGYYVSNDETNEVYVGWEDVSQQILLIDIGDYEKKLRFPNLRFLTLLLHHILIEKIEFATSGTYEIMIKDGKEKLEENDYSIFAEHIIAKDGLQVVETTEYNSSIETINVKAKIKAESPKALLISLDSGEEFWVPKSMVHSKFFSNDKSHYQNFIIDKWIVEKNKIIR